MKSVMISIQPKWCELIASGKKTVEVRKTKPKIETPFKVYIYVTKPRHYFKISEHLAATDENLFLSNGTVKMSDGFEHWADGIKVEHLNGKVIGEFVCDRIEEIGFSPEMHGVYLCKDQFFIEKSCIPFDVMFDYLGEEYGYGWHVSALVIYNKPKELSEFKTKKTITTLTTEHNIEGTVHYPKKEVVFDKLTKPPQNWCYLDE